MQWPACADRVSYIRQVFMFFFFKQKTAYEIRNCDWSSDVCSSDLSDFFFSSWNCADFAEENDWSIILESNWLYKGANRDRKSVV